MLTALLVLLRTIGLICRGHRAVGLENLALRQQVAALTPKVQTVRADSSDSHLTRRLVGSMLLRIWALPVPTG
jgi:hypothetical protein